MNNNGTPIFGLKLSQEFRSRPLQPRIVNEQSSHLTGRQDRIDAFKETGADTIGEAYDKLAQEAYVQTVIQPETKLGLGGIGAIAGVGGVVASVAMIGALPAVAVGALFVVSAATAIGGAKMHNSGQRTSTARALVRRLESEDLDVRGYRPDKKEKAERRKYRDAHQGGMWKNWNLLAQLPDAHEH